MTRTDSIQNELDELPLEDPETDMKAPVISKKRNSPPNSYY
jgi:hypothetical protein